MWGSLRPQFLLILGSVSHGFAVTAYALLRLTPQSPQVTHKPQSIKVVLFPLSGSNRNISLAMFKIKTEIF